MNTGSVYSKYLVYAPVTPPPGWAPEPQRKRFLTGIW